MTIEHDRVTVADIDRLVPKLKAAFDRTLSRSTFDKSDIGRFIKADMGQVVSIGSIRIYSHKFGEFVPIKVVVRRNLLGRVKGSYSIPEQRIEVSSLAHARGERLWDIEDARSTIIHEAGHARDAMNIPSERWALFLGERVHDFDTHADRIAKRLYPKVTFPKWADSREKKALVLTKIIARSTTGARLFNRYGLTPRQGRGALYAAMRTYMKFGKDEGDVWREYHREAGEVRARTLQVFEDAKKSILLGHCGDPKKLRSRGADTGKCFAQAIEMSEHYHTMERYLKPRELAKVFSAVAKNLAVAFLGSRPDTSSEDLEAIMPMPERRKGAPEESEGEKLVRIFGALDEFGGEFDDFLDF